ncbi:1-deoxy-D-xylulose-5-phosphate synthase N-terminal domain-containing protein [Streptomyces coeruleofuscus]|uniref:1-deoxy-D-xylulose-5-phosphate synthase n=1 Tax=Streptomyces coeruleofuscus TaxID=66879 RepID=A0ABP5V8X0_9ACTN
MTSLPRTRRPLLDDVHGPHDVRALEPGRLGQLAAETREFLRTRGGAAGDVELGIALHRVFDAHRDAVVWSGGRLRDVPLAYELLTGKREFTGADDRPRERSHAQVLSYAGGLARAFRLRGCADRHVVVVVDGEALAGGAGWEALGALAQAPELRIVVVVLEEGVPAREALRREPVTGAGLTGAWHAVGRGLRELVPGGAGPQGPSAGSHPAGGGPVGGAWHTVGRGLRELLAAQGTSAGSRAAGGGPVDGASGRSPGRGLPGLLAVRGGAAGLRMAGDGPVDGGSVADVEAALRAARDVGRPVLVHCVTRSRGRAVPPSEVVRAAPHDGPLPRTWASVFAEELARAGAERPEVVAVHAADRPGPELGPFADAYPDRVLGTGHTAAHATACAGGLAAGGLHPVLAVPDDSPVRALVPIAPRCGVTFALGRTGGTDVAELARLVPGLRCAAPRDGARLRALLDTALGVEDAPTVVYVPDGPAGPDIEAVAHDRGVDVLHRGPAAHGDVLVVAVGTTARVCLDAARLLDARGVAVTVVDPGWVAPLPAHLTELAAGHGLSVTVEEDGGIAGVAAELSRALDRQSPHLPLLRFSPPPDGTPLTPHAIAESVVRRLGEPDDVGA